MQTTIVRHISDVSSIDYDWTSGLRASPPRPQDDPEYVAADVNVTIANGNKLKSTLIFTSPRDKQDLVPLQSVSWLQADATAAPDGYAAFVRFRRALMIEAERRSGYARGQTLQSSINSSGRDFSFGAELSIFYASEFWKCQMSKPILLKLPELEWCILLEKAIWQAMPGISHGAANTFLMHLSSRCGTDLSRDLLKQLINEPFNHQSFSALLNVTKEGSARKQLSETVRHEVWRRDQGRCVRCGSSEKLEFDHIIPYSRGGSDTARNIQLLCEPCNRQKAASI